MLIASVQASFQHLKKICFTTKIALKHQQISHAKICFSVCFCRVVEKRKKNHRCYYISTKLVCTVCNIELSRQTNVYFGLKYIHISQNICCIKYNNILQRMNKISMHCPEIFYHSSFSRVSAQHMSNQNPDQASAVDLMPICNHKGCDITERLFELYKFAQYLGKTCKC